MSHYHCDAKTHAFVKTIADANDVILASPVYHGSYSGGLKNALDNLEYNAFGIKFLVISLMTI
ncbi:MULTISPECIES: NADPH-dependent FMN reductase [unclassified Bartonella]|uniref:NADPH-dependent FMN reductase n=1 Tax=unclassified Bartonella TaxID=2645622 RepID=UPI0035CFB000